MSMCAFQDGEDLAEVDLKSEYFMSQLALRERRNGGESSGYGLFRFVKQ